MQPHPRATIKPASRPAQASGFGSCTRLASPDPRCVAKPGFLDCCGIWSTLKAGRWSAWSAPSVLRFERFRPPAQSAWRGLWACGLHWRNHWGWHPRIPGLVADQLPSQPLILWIWVLGASYALLGAVCVAELAAAMPKQGLVRLRRRAFGRRAGFLVGWSDWIAHCIGLAWVVTTLGTTSLLLPMAALDRCWDLGALHPDPMARRALWAAPARVPEPDQGTDLCGIGGGLFRAAAPKSRGSSRELHPPDVNLFVPVVLAHTSRDHDLRRLGLPDLLR